MGCESCGHEFVEGERFFQCAEYGFYLCSPCWKKEKDLPVDGNGPHIEHPTWEERTW